MWLPGMKLITSFILCILCLSLLPPIQATSEEPTTIAQETFSWREFWKRHRRLAKWRLQYYNNGIWENKTGLLSIDFRKAFQNATHSAIKSTLTFTSQEAGAYHLILVFRKALLHYIAKLDKFRYNLTYQDHNIIFDWSDLTTIPNLIINHGTTWIEQHNNTDIEFPYFWIILRHNNVPANYELILDPVTISTSGTAGATYKPPQHNIHRSNATGNYYFAFYTNGSYLCYRTSSDGSSWGNEIAIRWCPVGEWFDVAYNPNYSPNYFYYAWANGSLYAPVLFCRGTINATGNGITWGTEVAVRSGQSFLHFWFPSVGCADNGYVFVGVCRGVEWNHRFCMYWHPLNTGLPGTWSSKTNFADNASPLIGDHHEGGIERLDNNEMYSAYSWGGDIKGRLWNGSAWQTLEYFESQSAHKGFDLTVDDLQVHFGYISSHAYPPPKCYRKRFSNGTWSNRETVYSPSAIRSYMTLCVDTATEDVYYFWGDRLGSPTFYYRVVYNKRDNISGTWGSLQELALNEPYLKYPSINAMTQSYSNLIGVVWTRGQLSPFDIRFATLDISPVVAAWHLVETWYGELWTKAWLHVETWYGELWTRTWRFIETWHGRLTPVMWNLVEAWYGIMNYTIILAYLIALMLGLTGIVIIFLWRRKNNSQ